MSIRAYVNPYPPRFPEAWQRARLSAGATVYVQTKGGEQRDKLILSLRPGDVVEVAALFLLARLTGGSKRRTNDLFGATNDILGQGASIREGKDGRSSKFLKDWRAAMAGAREAISASARGMATGAANGAMSKGKPPLKSKLPPQALVIIEREWHSKKHKTRQAALDRINELLAAMDIKIKRGWLYANYRVK